MTIPTFYDVRLLGIKLRIIGEGPRYRGVNSSRLIPTSGKRQESWQSVGLKNSVENFFPPEEYKDVDEWLLRKHNGIKVLREIF